MAGAVQEPARTSPLRTVEDRASSPENRVSTGRLTRVPPRKV